MPPFSLRTPRLLLRPWHFSDVPAVLGYSADPAFSRFLRNFPEPYTEGDAEHYIATCILGDWDIHAQFAIEFEGAAIGDISLYIDVGTKVGTLGYGIAPSHWGKGIVTEAAGTVIAYAFDTLKLPKVRATADGENVASHRVMEKLGMQREGYFHSHRVLRGERRDMVEYGLVSRKHSASINKSKK